MLQNGISDNMSHFQMRNGI